MQINPAEMSVFDQPGSAIPNGDSQKTVASKNIARVFDSTVWWLLLGIFAIALAAFPMRGGESLIRLATGRALSEGAVALGEEPFSYALKDSKWVNGAWLFDRMLYAAWQLDGGQGRWIVALKAFGFVLVGWSVFAVAGKGPVRQLMAPMLATAALLGVSGQADVGPHLATLFCMTVLLVLLGKFESIGPEGAIKAYSLMVFLGFALWANLDSGFLFGLAVVLIWGAAHLLLSGKRALPFGALMISAFLGSLVNPFLFRVYQLPETLGFFEGVDELRKDGRVYLQHLGSFLEWLTASWNQSFIPFPAVVGIGLLVLALGCLGWSFFRTGEKKILWRVLVLVGFLVLGLARFRLIGLGGLVSGLFLAEYLRGITRNGEGREEGENWLARLSGLAALLALIGACLFTGYLRPSAKTSREFGWGFVWAEGMRDLAKEVAVRGGQIEKALPLVEREKMLVVENGGEMASYLIWFAPKYSQFLDGRWSRSARVLADYRKLCAGLGIDSPSSATGIAGEDWRSNLESQGIHTVVANLLGDSPGVLVAPRFSRLSDWQSPYLAGAGQVATLRRPPQRNPNRSSDLVNAYFDILVNEAIRDHLDWGEGRLDQPVKIRPFWKFWAGKPTISGKSIEAEIRANLSGQYRRPDARVAQALLAVRQAHVAMAEQPDNPGCLLVTLQCLGQLSDLLGVQQEGGVLADLIELEMITLAQRVLDLAGNLEDERSDRVRSARLVLYQVAMRRNFWDLMEEHGKALLEGSRDDLAGRGEDGLKRLEALEEQIQQIGKRKTEAEDRLANAMERMKSNSGGKEPPLFFQAMTALEMGLPLRAMRDLQSAGASEQVRESEQLQINFALINLQLALQLGRVDEVRSFLEGPGKQLLDRPETLRMNHPGVLLPQLLNAKSLQVENRNYPLYDWMMIEASFASGRYKDAAQRIERLAALKKDLVNPALKRGTLPVLLQEGPFSLVAGLSSNRDTFSLASQVLGASGMPGVVRTFGPVTHELVGMTASAEAMVLRQMGMVGELEGICGYLWMISANTKDGEAALGRSLALSVNIGFVARAMMRASAPCHPLSPLLAELGSNLTEGAVPSWHNRLAWVRILDSLWEVKPQGKETK